MEENLVNDFSLDELCPKVQFGAPAPDPSGASPIYHYVWGLIESLETGENDMTEQTTMENGINKQAVLDSWYKNLSKGVEELLELNEYNSIISFLGSNRFVVEVKVFLENEKLIKQISAARTVTVNKSVVQGTARVPGNISKIYELEKTKVSIFVEGEGLKPLLVWEVSADVDLVDFNKCSMITSRANIKTSEAKDMTTAIIELAKKQAAES